MRCVGGAGIPDVLAGVGGPRRRGHRRRNDLCALAACADACHTDTGGFCLPNTTCSVNPCDTRGLGSHAAYSVGVLAAADHVRHKRRHQPAERLTHSWAPGCRGMIRRGWMTWSPVCSWAHITAGAAGGPSLGGP